MNNKFGLDISLRVFNDVFCNNTVRSVSVIIVGIFRETRITFKLAGIL